jgi:branched-chain amino acid transport system ATP-binding protein
VTDGVVDFGEAAAKRRPLLSCRGIRAGYRRTVVVRSFDLDVEAGTVVALLGPNGAGKTTLLTTLAGLLPAQAGAVVVGGQTVKPGRPAAASRAGLVLVPDDRALFTSLTVDDNLAAAQASHHTHADDVIRSFPGLERRRNVLAGNLSGGEQQMLAMARALMQEPRVLLIDEMSMGLAPIVVESLLPVVRDVADRTGAVVVLVEQHVNLALEVADRALIMVRGEIVLDRPADELRRRPELIEAAYFGGTKPRHAHG